MKILKIEDNKGLFYCINTKVFKPIDQIDRDGLMELLNYYLDNYVEIDEYDERHIQNQAQQIIYRSVSEKFKTFNKNQFKDESARKYLDDINKYKVNEPN